MWWARRGRRKHRQLGHQANSRRNGGRQGCTNPARHSTTAQSWPSPPPLALLRQGGPLTAGPSCPPGLQRSWGRSGPRSASAPWRWPLGKPASCPPPSRCWPGGVEGRGGRGGGWGGVWAGPWWVAASVPEPRHARWAARLPMAAGVQAGAAGATGLHRLTALLQAPGQQHPRVPDPWRPSPAAHGGIHLPRVDNRCPVAHGRPHLAASEAT